MAEIITIPRQVLHQEVAVRLRQRIVEGQLAPGSKLNERELAELLNVSRTPLREAIKMLLPKVWWNCCRIGARWWRRCPSRTWQTPSR
jgi:DNA-binding FadR family transcriptional regulator